MSMSNLILAIVSLVLFFTYWEKAREPGISTALYVWTSFLATWWLVCVMLFILYTLRPAISF